MPFPPAFPSASPAASPRADAPYYARLEHGARYLASRSADAAQRGVHLDMAARYRRLGRDARGGTR
jgi:hypothetical protein